MPSPIKCLLFASCLAIIMSHKSSEALLLGSFIGCNSFHCRISALESDVAQLKQQVARLDPSGSLNNFQRPTNMLPFNQNGMNNLNQQQQGNQMSNMQQQNGQMPNGNQQQQGGAAQIDPSGQNVRAVNSFSDYPAINNQNLRRSGYQNGGQFLSI